MPYACPIRRAEASRQACKRYYRRYHAKELERSARYRQSNRRLVRKRQREWMRRKLLADPTWRCRIALQVDWKRKCRRKGVFHSEPVLELLGMPWEQFTRRLESQFKRRGWTWQGYGSEWTLDHKLPSYAFKLQKYEDRAICSHFSNLQVLSVEANRAKNGSYSKVELRCYKTQWRSTFGRRLRQALLFKQSRSERKPICPF
jgi:hypothetical protein